MANGRRSRSGPARAITMVLAAAVTASLVTPVAAAPAAPPAAASAIGAGMASGLPEYQVANYLAAAPGDEPPPDIEDVVTAPPTACQLLPGVVPQAEIDRVLGNQPQPAGEGAWRYEVCAATPDIAANIARNNPTAELARQFCEQPEQVCAVFARWLPAGPQEVRPADQDGRRSYLQSLFRFAPILQTSPENSATHGLIANFPVWFWNTVETTFPKAVPGGQAWHLWTEFHTDNQRACRRSGLNQVGTVWRRGDFAPETPSPSRCGYTYNNQGQYVVRGCTRWLFIIAALLVPIVFAATFCDNDTMDVKEVQVVGGSDPRRIPIG